MRRRLDLAATLVARPEVLFLDEPTTGLDPRARNELWDVLDGLVGEGTTVLLTTQYLEEAERLADDIVVVDHGRVIARGDARELKRQVGGDQLHVVVVDPARPGRRRPSSLERDRRRRARRSTSPSARSTRADRRRRRGDRRAGRARSPTPAIEVDDLGLRQPTLDDVFLTLTGAPPESTTTRRRRRPSPEEAR